MVAKARKTADTETPAKAEYQYDAQGRVSLAALLTKDANYTNFGLWCVGETPLITHAWSQKAKTEMLQKQAKAAKAGRDARDPEADFQNSLYDLPDGGFGFPATGLKNAILSAAHKDKGVPRTALQSALWVDHEIVSVRPALAGAICDMPMLRIYGSQPQMREDMVRVGAMVKTSTLAYRGQFSDWALHVTGRVNTDTVSLEQLVFLIRDAGSTIGLGEWRNERKGVFGAFRIAGVQEAARWDAYAAGDGPLPVRSTNLAVAA